MAMQLTPLQCHLYLYHNAPPPQYVHLDRVHVDDDDDDDDDDIKV